MADFTTSRDGALPPPPDEQPTPVISATGGAERRGFDRVPPHSLEAEVSVLGACLLSRSAAVEVSEFLEADDFYRSAHRLVYEAIQDLMQRGEPVDPVTLLDHLAATDHLAEVGGAQAIHDLVSSTPTAANAVHYGRIVRDRALMRRLIQAGTDIVKLGYDPTDDPVGTVSTAESIMFSVADSGTTGEATALKDLLSESFRAIEELAEKGDDVTGLPTGFRDLDRLTAGLQPQNLVILAARPAMGKSSLSLSIAHYVTAELQEPVAIFSLEMSKQEIVQRLLSSEAMIDSSRLRTGRLEDHDWRKLGEALGKLAEAPLFIDDTPSINLMEIASKCRRLKQRHGLKLVIVDYLQLMTSHRRVDNRQEEVAQISRGLKMLAKELDIPVMALSQLNRSPEARTDKRPMLADLRESGCLTRSTRIMRADTGTSLTFGELLDADLRDVPVWAADGTGRFVPARLTHAFPSGRKEVFRVRLRSGRVVEATANHPFRCLHGWSPLGDLTIGSRVAVARRLPEPVDPIPMDRDEVVLLAHLIGEGTIRSRQPVHYTSADAANLEAVEKAAFRRFGIIARRDADGRSAVTTQLHLPAPHHLTHGRRNPIAAWLDDLGLWDCRSWEKHLPAEVFALPDDQVRLFLHHLWSTDGTIVVRPRDRSGPAVEVSYATSSHRLALDVQMLLLRLDIRSRVREVPSRSSRPGYRVEIAGVDLQRRFLRGVGVHGERGARVPKALERLEGIVGNPDVATDDMFWDEIVAIESLGVQDVFDATVEGLHNFVAEGVVLHNSVEQDADIVGFIYRDEVYDEQSPDRGIAELIISKHRNGGTGVVRLAFLGHVTKFANLARGAVGVGGDGGPPAAPPPNGPPL